jgi:hypothetical protein
MEEATPRSEGSSVHGWLQIRGGVVVPRGHSFGGTAQKRDTGSMGSAFYQE